jgi:hypothetical protein
MFGHATTEGPFIEESVGNKIKHPSTQQQQQSLSGSKAATPCKQQN